MFKFKKIFKSFKKEKRKKKRKPENQEKTKEKTMKKKENSPTAALTGRPNIAPTRAERGSVPLTGGA
jgi:outer membrane biosynthesis protein TonB